MTGCTCGPYQSVIPPGPCPTHSSSKGIFLNVIPRVDVTGLRAALAEQLRQLADEIGGEADSDEFERSSLGSNWTVTSSRDGV